MAKRHNPEETPGARRQRERYEREQQDRADRAAAARKASHQRQQERIERTRAARKEQDEARRREAAGRGTARRAAEPAAARYGQNEAAAYEYLKRHPEARVQEVAFHAIYGGGAVAWEGLHWKTRRNAESEAARVISRLKAEGKVKVIGHTLGGKPKYAAVGDTPTADESGKPWYERGRKGKVSGRDEPQPGATDKGSGSMGVFGAPGSQGGDDAGSESTGSLGVFGAPGEGADDSGDDDGPRDGKLW